MTPTEAIAHANVATSPIFIVCTNPKQAQDISDKIEQLTALLLPGMGGEAAGKEAMRFRTGQVDILVATRTHIIGIVLRREHTEVIFTFQPTPQELNYAKERAALRDLTERGIIDAQKTDGTGRDAGACQHVIAARAQAREREAVSAACLLDQGRVAQSLEDARTVASHIIGDRQNKTCRELTQRSPCTGKCRGIGEKFFACQQAIELFGALDHIAIPGFLHLGDVIGHTPEHPFDRLDERAITAAADVTLCQHLPGVISQFDLGQTLRHGRCGK